MRISHVVTLVSDGGAYGGPVSVATAQLGELAARGHTTLLLSLWRSGRGGPPPRHWDGVPLLARRARVLVPGTGFLGLLNPLLLLDLWREAGRADVLHVHAGRDLVSLAALAAAALRRTRLVVQTHGMVQPRHGAPARVFDRLYVPLMRRARACLCLTDAERAGVEKVLSLPSSPSVPPPGPRPRPTLVSLRNGVRAQPAAAERQLRRARPTSGLPAPDVLFLARLHPVKRPEAFVEAAALVAAVSPRVSFTLHGADEGSLAGVRRLIEGHALVGAVRCGGPLDHPAALRRIREADVYVLPSSREVFPMSLLEALAAGTPVVCTEGCGIAAELAAPGAAFVTDGSPEALAGAVLQLLGDPALARAQAEAGLRAVDEAYSITAVTDRLEEVYRDA